MGCLIAGQAGEEPLGDQVSGQDQQGEDEHLVEAVHVLQLLDHGGENHGPGPGDENEGADGDHGIDEVVAEHLDETGQSVGGDHPEDGLEPAVPHEHGCGFPAGVHLGQGVLHHQIGGGEVVDDVAQDHQQQGILQAAAGEEKQIGHTQHHAGDGVGHQGNALDDPLVPRGQGAPGGDEGGAVGRQSAQEGSEQGHHQRVPVDGNQLAVGEYGGEVLQGEAGLIGPLLHQWDHKDHREDRQDGH